MKGQGNGSIEPRGAKYRAVFRSPSGTRETATFATEAEAALWLAAKRVDVARGVWQPPRPPVPTLGEYGIQWVRERRNTRGEPLKPRTREGYERLLATTLEPLSGLPLDEIRPPVVRAWYASLDSTPTHQANSYLLLTAIMHTAVQDELVTRNPCMIRGGGSKRRATSTDVLTPSQVEELAAAMPERYRALVLISAWCGLRSGEAFALRRSDVSPGAARLTVVEAVTYTRGEKHVLEPKSEAGSRTIAVPPHIRQRILEHLRRWTGEELDALVFTSSRGSMLRQSTLAKSFYRARGEIGRPDLRWHDLRHTGATLTVETGASLPETMVRLGQSTPAAAMRYIHARQSRDEAIAESLSELAQLRSVREG